MTMTAQAATPRYTRIRAVLKVALADQDLFQKDIADWIGVKPSGVTDRMQGKTPWLIDELDTVAERLDISIAVLIGDQPYVPGRTLANRATTG